MAILAWDHPRESVKVRHSPLASENVTNNRHKFIFFTLLFYFIQVLF